MTREDQIKKAAEIIAYGCSDELKAALIQDFPELAESEDERIRKEIIKCIESLSKSQRASSRLYDWIAYLEKQKDNAEKEYVFRPLAGTDITIAAEQAIRRAKEGDHLVLAFNGWYVPVDKHVTTKGLVDSYDTFIEKQKESENISASTVFPSCWAEEPSLQKEQKPAYKIEPKFNIGDTIINKKNGEKCTIANRCLLYQYYSDINHCHEIKFDEQDDWELVEQKEQKSIFPEGLGEVRWNPISVQKEQKPNINIDQLKSLMLQYLQEAANEKDDSDIQADTEKWARKILEYDFEQKQEWSEEDEKIAKEIEEELWYPGDFPDYPSKEESELYDDCQRRLDWFKNKLKSLRERFNSKKCNKGMDLDTKLQDRLEEISRNGLENAHTIDFSKEYENSKQILEKSSNSTEWSEEDKEALDMCLDAIPKRWKTKSGILLTKWLKDNIHIQSKQEWSEEELDKVAEEYVWTSIDSNDPILVPKYIPLLLSLFKGGYAYATSLCAQWKPSEEQINAFKNSVEHIPNAYYDDMWELYEQLKKLM